MDPGTKGTRGRLIGPETTPHLLSQLADWLESYSKIMELNVWTSSTVTSAEKDASGAWVIHLTRILPDGTEIKRVLRPVHLVSAQGLGAGSWTVPKLPKQVLFPTILRARVPGADSLLLPGRVLGRGHPRLRIHDCEEIRWKEGYRRWDGYFWP